MKYKSFLFSGLHIYIFCHDKDLLHNSIKKKRIWILPFAKGFSRKNEIFRYWRKNFRKWKKVLLAKIGVKYFAFFSSRKSFCTPNFLPLHYAQGSSPNVSSNINQDDLRVNRIWLIRLNSLTVKRENWRYQKLWSYLSYDFLIHSVWFESKTYLSKKIILTSLDLKLL